MSNSATNPLSNSIVVSSATLTTNKTNPNKITTTTKKSNISSIEIGTKCGTTKKIPSKVSASSSVNEIKNGLNSVLAGNKGVNKVNNNQNQTMNGYKSMNGTITNHLNNNNNETKPVLSSDSFKRRLGTNPISPYKNPDFLKCEYDLLRSQVIVSSRSRSACGEKNNNINNNNSTSETNKTNGVTSTSLTSSPAKDSNRNKVTIFGVNSTSPVTTSSINSSTLSGTANKIVDKNARKTENSTNNNSNENMSVNCAQHGVDILDDIKYIDSDDSERRNSPNTMNVATLKEFFNDNMAHGKSIKNTSTLPTGASKKLNDIYSNKYNTITNGSCAHQANANFGNGIARKAVPEEMLSSTSSSTSTLSAMTESSTSSLLPKTSTKENGTSIKLNHLDGGDSVSVSACDGFSFDH